MNTDFYKNFLKDTDETGRFLVRSQRTGKTYCVEAIGNPATHFGDLNPATGKVEGSYGKKHKGSIKESESLITEDNCINIQLLPIGTSPIDFIQRLDEKYPTVI